MTDINTSNTDKNSAHIINKDGWLPSYFHIPQHEYIFLTSLNLGGAEKIVCDQLWANYYCKFPTQYTLIVLYDKEKEHGLPPNVQVVRLKSDLANGKFLFQQIAIEKKVVVCHLINDKIANALFEQHVKIQFVLHNDRRSWSNSDELLNHPNIVSVIAVCDYVKEQTALYTDKPLISIRHQIKYRSYLFDDKVRDKVRKELNFSDDDIVIGMVGRIAEQKNYSLAIDTLFHLVQANPNYKLVIAGGFEKKFAHIYIDLLKRINLYKLHKHVQLLGFRKDVIDLVNSFDIALNTSYFEGLSMAVQELMGNGLPIVLSDVCGQKEIYDNCGQLNFFEIPEECSDLSTLHYDYFNNPPEYINLINTIAQKIETSIATGIDNNSLQATDTINTRIAFTEQDLQKIGRLCYGSHRLWSLFNHIKPLQNTGKTAFLTSNLNLGGAQRSLVNLMTYIQNNKEVLNVEDSFNPTLILINQSNQNQFLNLLAESRVPCFISQSSIDVFEVMKNMLDFIAQEGIDQIVFWNVESKVKLLLAKLISHHVKLIDVSPGDYIFNELRNETDFQESIYYTGVEYYGSIHRFISKFTFSQTNEYLDVLKNPAVVIPNGVYITPQYVKNIDTKSEETFKFLVCGRIAPSKHLEVIFDAFRLLCKEKELTGSKLSVSVIGNAEEYYKDYYFDLQKNYQDLIDNDSILFLGYHENPQAVMKNYDCIIVLGTHQGSPNTVLEAAACNLPVISNDSGGTKEVINDDTGILLPAIPDAEYLLPAMRSMMDNYSLYQEKSLNCFNKVNTEFSMKTMAQKYLEVLSLNLEEKILKNIKANS
jgi:glycosyltransferase involved in cell wall biosynthesis